MSFIGVLVTANVINAYPSIAIQLDADSLPKAMPTDVKPVAGSPETAPKPDGVAPVAQSMMVMPEGGTMPAGVAMPMAMPVGMPMPDVKNMAAMVGSAPAGVMNSMTATGVAMPMAMPVDMPMPDAKNMAAVVGSMPAGAMPPVSAVKDMSAMVGSIPAGVMSPMAVAAGPMPDGEVRTMSATGDVKPVAMEGPMPPVRDMQMMDPDKAGSTMPEGEMKTMDMKPMPLGGPMDKAPMEAPDMPGGRPEVMSMSADNNEMARPIMAMAPAGMKQSEPSETADGGKPKMVQTMMSMGSPDEKPMYANKAVMRTQGESMDAMPAKNAKDASNAEEDSKQTDVASDAQDKVGTKKNGMKKPAGEKKLAGSQRKNGSANKKRNGVASKAQNGIKKGQNGNKKGQSGAKKMQNGTNNKRNQNDANKKARNAQKKAKKAEEASADLKQFG